MTNTIEYKGYISTIEYSHEDKLFFGKIEMIDDLVTFEADAAHDLEKTFIIQSMITYKHAKN